MRSRIGSDDGSLPGVGAAASPWIGDDETVFQFVEDFGEITAGTRLAFPHAGRVSGEPNGRSYLPVDAAGAEIVAIDGQGRPALLRNPVGSGCAVLLEDDIELQQAEGELTLGPFGVAAVACRSAVDRDRATERDLVLQATSMVGRTERRDARA